MKRKRHDTFASLLSAKPTEEEATKPFQRADVSREEMRKTSPTVARTNAIQEATKDNRLVTLPPSLIKDSLLTDRFSLDAEIDDLVESIREFGQRVPAQVRRLPSGDREIVYGRRRLEACRRLGRDLLCQIVDMTDEEAIAARGLENSARRDPSFIEKAFFAYDICKAGHTTDFAGKALSTNRFQISRMTGIIEDLPEELIRAIGPAPKSGRRPWEDLRKLTEGWSRSRKLGLINDIRHEDHSDKRLQTLLKRLAPTRPTSEAAVVPGHITALSAGPAQTTYKMADPKEEGFLTFLDSQMPELYARWQSERDDS